MLLRAIREKLVTLNQALPQNGLATWTSGNVGVRDPETGLVAIKASGVHFRDLTAESMVVVDLEGSRIDGRLKPSSDTASHLYIYRYRPDVNAVVHTRSSYATAFAALGRSIPVYLTAQADEFGGPIPCGGFALIGGEQIGRVVVESIGDSLAVLLKNQWGVHCGAQRRSRAEGGRDGRRYRPHRLAGAAAWDNRRRLPAELGWEAPSPISARGTVSDARPPWCSGVEGG